MRPTILFIILIWFAGLPSKAQEELVPLTVNPYTGPSRSGDNFSRDQDSLFFYVEDTLTLPLRDDFSTDKFKPFITDTSSLRVTDSTLYKLYNTNNTVIYDTVGFMEDTTFKYDIDTVSGDTQVVNKVPLASSEILVNDMLVFPRHDTARREVWPAYEIFDTLWQSSVDTVYLSPDHAQDSLIAHIVEPDSSNIWADRFAFRNFTLPDQPPTIGVATLDGLDENGYPYNFSNPYSYGEADHLTSKYIDLSSYTPLNNIYLSFFYQPTGIGNEPEQEDSLVVEFYAPGDSSWHQVWSHDGTSLQPFEQVVLPVTDSKYLGENFKFRFKNFSTLSGSFDHWHIDYVRMAANRSSSDTVIDEVAFTEMPITFLPNYTSVPWEHFKRSPKDPVDVYTSSHRNLSNTGRFVNFYSRAFFEGNQIWDLDQGVDANAPANSPFSKDFLLDQGSPSFDFDTSLTDSAAEFEISLIERSQPDTNSNNDSITFIQAFRNYYSYDDGTAEAAYGVTGNNAQIAMRFQPYTGDTLLGAFIYFAPSRRDVTQESFFLTLWEDDNGIPGAQEYQNISFSRPEYSDENGEFIRYFFDDPVVVNGPFFIGVDQTTNARLNIGYDRNTDHSQNHYYNTSGTWQNTSFPGTLMIRPIFNSRMNVVSLPEDARKELHSTIYPNPTKGKVHIQTSMESAQLYTRVMDMTGRVVGEFGHNQRTLDLSHLDQGIYLLRIHDRGTGRSTVRKLMIRK